MPIPNDISEAEVLFESLSKLIANEGSFSDWFAQ